MSVRRVDRRAPWAHPLAMQCDRDGTPIRHGADTPNGAAGASRDRMRVELERFGSAGAGLAVPTPIRPHRLGRPRASRAERVQARRDRRNRASVLA